ncbi:hypothetical protein B0H13DRAFT_2331674 [Mycena leptocephala]|nr:hypothetical protein B0H13DRAFT_2331674 [Mycena leptocephala]
MTTTSSQKIAEYLRVAAYAVALFDYLQTLPAEYCLYAKQKGPFQLSLYPLHPGPIHRYHNNHHREYRFFYDGFSAEKCHRFYWLAPIFKLVLYTISQAILAIRTYAVSCKSPLVLCLLILLSVLIVVPELIPHAHEPDLAYCTSGNLPGVKVASLFDVGVLVFDVVTMFITASYVRKFSSSSRTSTTLGYAATMIFSGRFILNLSEHVRDGVSGDNSSILSRTPQHNRTNGFRAPNSAGPELVVTVMKNVITIWSGTIRSRSRRRSSGQITEA